MCVFVGMTDPYLYVFEELIFSPLRSVCGVTRFKVANEERKWDDGYREGQKDINIDG